MAMNRAQLVDAIFDELERVWGDEDRPASREDYAWLEKHYGVTEAEDLQWMLIVDYEEDELSDDELEDADTMDFLEDNLAVILFLEGLLRKYQSNTVVWQ